MKRKGLIISGTLSFALCLLLYGLMQYLAGCNQDQQMAERWSEKKNVAQVSCFFSTDAGITTDSIEEFRHSLNNALQEGSITSESENPGARLWADAYSADGKITLSNDKTRVEADAIGIGGDFFLFHPVRLLEGAYFSGNDVNQDYCIIDEDMAWQLFGSNDVDGQIVYIQGIPHIITGVVERPEGRLERAAGLDSTLVYVSYQTLEQLGTNNGINHYEIVMPNPVNKYAVNLVRERFAANEKQVEILENTSRYSLVNEWKILLSFGTRSMNGKAIIYPYWENIARGYEDIIALVVLFMTLLLAYPVILAVVLFIIWWKHKGWTIKGVCLKGKDKWERFLEQRREKKRLAKIQEETFEEEEKL